MRIGYFCPMKLALISIVLLGLAFAGIAIKIIVKKDGKFAGTCASQSPFLNKKEKPAVFVVNCRMNNTVKIQTYSNLKSSLHSVFLSIFVYNECQRNPTSHCFSKTK